MEQLLIIIVSATVRDDLIDTLITYEGISGFNLQEINGFSREHSKYSLSEQVAGYRKLFRFEVMHDRDQEAQLLSQLGKVCGASHARYWIMPLSRSGQLGSGIE